MMKKKSILMQVGLLMGLTLSLTSCEDILGEWDRPTPQTPAVEPSVTYYAWDSESGSLKPKTITGGITNITETTTSWSGVCVVDKDVIITGDVTMADDVELIIADGAKLTINGKVAASTHDLKLYGQEAKSGQFVVDNSAAAGKAIEVKGLEIAGLKVNVTAQTGASGSAAINTSGKTVVYDGADVTANGKQSIYVNDEGELEILGGTLNLTGYSQNYAPTITFERGTINATSDGNGGVGIFNAKNINIKPTITELKITNTGCTGDSEEIGKWIQASTSMKFGSNTDIHETWNNSSTKITKGTSYSSAGYTNGFTIARGDDANKTILTITPTAAP